MSDQTSEIEKHISDAEFAFVVIKQKDGRFAIANINNENIVRSPTMDDVQHALFTLQQDMNRQQTVVAVAAAMQQFAGAVPNAQQPAVAPEKRFVKRNKSAV